MQAGDVLSWQRTFTEEDIRAFTRMSGDEGVHHLEYDAQGRLMAQGLLTATLPTKIGGDMNFIARELCFQFLRPVYAGDTITCEVTITEHRVDESVTRQSSTFVCRNQHDKEVMTGHAHGIIRKG
ncbi:MAG TPA: MaoC family dehydratase N-terminal domain-containing protein [Blastocatellia bacterium]|nr:MaoC family dehydratase N-terminal domain-containing protein [Blastocatellia bacterium]